MCSYCNLVSVARLYAGDAPAAVVCAPRTCTASCPAEEGSAGRADQSLVLGKAWVRRVLRAQLSCGRGSQEHGVPGSEQTFSRLTEDGGDDR